MKMHILCIFIIHLYFSLFYFFLPLLPLLLCCLFTVLYYFVRSIKYILSIVFFLLLYFIIKNSINIIFIYKVLSFVSWMIAIGQNLVANPFTTYVRFKSKSIQTAICCPLLVIIGRLVRNRLMHFDCLKNNYEYMLQHDTVFEWDTMWGFFVCFLCTKLIVFLDSQDSHVEKWGWRGSFASSISLVQ